MTPETTHYLNIFLGLGAIGLQIISVITLFLLFWGQRKNSDNKYLSFIKDKFIIIGFLLSFAPALFSLFYSEILNYAPCYHCWIQRIALFPQTILFGVAWLRSDRNVIWYSLPLLLVGLADAIYLNYLYYFNPSSAPCDASGVSCVQHLVSEFGGYISIPMLAITSFASILVLVLVAHYYKRED